MHAAITCSEPNVRQGGRNRSTAQAPWTTTQDRQAQKLNIEHSEFVPLEKKSRIARKQGYRLNKRISSIDSMQVLCELVHASSTQFDHVVWPQLSAKSC